MFPNLPDSKNIFKQITLFNPNPYFKRTIPQKLKGSSKQPKTKKDSSMPLMSEKMKKKLLMRRYWTIFMEKQLKLRVVYQNLMIR